jgi:anti-sigma B factor antagonist
MVKCEKHEEITIISLQGIKSLDALVAFRIKAEIKAMIYEKGIKLIVDFKGVEFIDSAGFGVLLSVLKTVKNQMGQMKLSGINPEMGKLFKYLNLNKVFELYPDRQKCIDSFK